ncbi:hypothetical protein E2C01_078633 [Portunus trituberculatus]|uniref:Uncharacterized protein n=1 Tax=Portunus trituberculatus TaxID=210409 RepID=A0A5B7IJC0_PORTR|nr:hypothetical protein [Portunus trituberculatus]
MRVSVGTSACMSLFLTPHDLCLSPSLASPSPCLPASLTPSAPVNKIFMDIYLKFIFHLPVSHELLEMIRTGGPIATFSPYLTSLAFLRANKGLLLTHRDL